MYKYKIDPTKLEVIATVNTGVNPTAMTIDSSNKLYVANSNGYSISGSDSVTVIDLDKQMSKKTIKHESFNEPFTVTLSKNENEPKLYVTNSNSTTISIIDLQTNKVSVIDGFNGPSGMVIHPNKITAYVNNYGAIDSIPSGQGNTVSVVDLKDNIITKEIKLSGSETEFPAAPAAIAIDTKGDFVYTANYVNGKPDSGSVTKISTKKNSVEKTIPGFSGPFSITINSTDEKAYLTNFGSNDFAPYGETVGILDFKTDKITKINTGGIQPAGFAIFGGYGFVSNYNTLYRNGSPNFTGLTAGQGTVNIIKLSDNTLVPTTINVGQSPGSISISPGGKYIVVSNYTSNTVSIISHMPDQ